MGFLDELKRLTHPYEDEMEDDYDEDEDVYEDEDEPEERNQTPPPREREEPRRREYQEPPRRNNGGKVVNIHATTQLAVVLVKPERYEDAASIADHLNAKKDGCPEPGADQQGCFQTADRLFVRGRLRQQRADEACGQQYIHHHPIQCGHCGRSFR